MKKFRVIVSIPYIHPIHNIIDGFKDHSFFIKADSDDKAAQIGIKKCMSMGLDTRDAEIYVKCVKG